MSSAPGSDNSPRPADDTGSQGGDFPKEARLAHKSEFDVVFQQGRKVVGRRIVAWIHPSPAGKTRPRLGLAVGKRIGNAPRRNRAKRVLRAAFRSLAPGLPRAVDIVIVPRAHDPPRTAEQAHEALDGVLKTWARRERDGDDDRPRPRRPRRGPRGGRTGRPSP